MKTVKFTGISAKWDGQDVTIPLPTFKTHLSHQNKPYELSLFLDTGSNGSMLYPHPIKSVAPDFNIGNEELRIEVMLERFDELPVNTLKRMRIDQDARAAEGENPIIAGIIGSDFLKDYVLHINYGSSEFSLLKNEGFLLPDTCRFSFENNFLYLYADLLGTEFKLLYDTGMGGGLLLFERGFEKIPRESLKLEGSETAQGAFGATYKYDAYDKVNLMFTPTLQFETEFGVQENHPMTDICPADGILGNQLFAGREICIDYPRQKFSFS